MGEYFLIVVNQSKDSGKNIHWMLKNKIVVLNPQVEISFVSLVRGEFSPFLKLGARTWEENNRSDDDAITMAT